MKTFLIAFGAFLFVSGCSQKPDPRDAKIAGLEKQLVQMEANHQRLRDSHTNLEAVVEQLLRETHSSFADLRTMTMNLGELYQKKHGEMMELIAAMATPPPRQSAPVRYAPVQAPPPARPATKDGIPLAVWNEIAAKAAQDWPGNYQMQVDVIKMEVEAYRKLHP